MPDRGDVETDHAALVGEFLHRLQRRVGIAERQVDHGRHAVVTGEHLLRQPAVVGERELDFHLRVGMQSQLQHRGGEHHLVIDAQRVHGALRHDDVGVDGVVPDVFEAHAAGMLDAAGDILEIEARLGVQEPAGIAAVGPLERLRHVAHDRILDVLDDARPRAVLEMMRVDIDHQNVVEPALLLLALGMGQHVAGRSSAVELLDIEFPDAVRSLDHRPYLPYSPFPTIAWRARVSHQWMVPTWITRRWRNRDTFPVMPGLVPGIHVGPPPRPLPARTAMPRDVDGRNKSGHDDGG